MKGTGWTEHEIALIVRMTAERKTAGDIKKLIPHRSVNSIKACRMRFVGHVTNRRYSGIADVVLKLHNEGKTIPQICAVVHRAHSTIYNMMTTTLRVRPNGVKSNPHYPEQSDGLVYREAVLMRPDEIAAIYNRFGLYRSLSFAKQPYIKTP